MTNTLKGKRLIFTIIFLIGISWVSSFADLPEILKRGKIRIACKDSFRPFGYFNENNQWIGFDIDIAKKLAKKLKREFSIEVEWIKVTSSADRIRFLKNNKVDIVIASFSITPERKKVIDFTNSYFYNEGITILVPVENTDINSVRDLANKKILVTAKSTGEAFLRKNIPSTKIIPVPNDDFAIKYLKEGKGDAYIQDKPVCLYHVKESPYFKIVGKPFTLHNVEDHYGFGIKQNSPQLKEYLNKFIAELKLTGEYRKIYTKWFGKYMGSTLNFYLIGGEKIKGQILKELPDKFIIINKKDERIFVMKSAVLYYKQITETDR